MPGTLPTQSANAVERFTALLHANRSGAGVGVYSICSANRYVLEAAIEQARRDASLLLIESTSNQVNQFGGYTGQTPADFAKFVHKLAADFDFPPNLLVLGGDHLGPHPWRKEPAANAMQKAQTLVRDSVLAGYTKIHLDASMRCADDPGDPHSPLGDEVVSDRAAAMCLAAEAAHAELPPGSPRPVYVIGTEVPIPGGELLGNRAPEVTSTAALEKTLHTAQHAFAARGLQSAWERVLAVVVQPGVEFADTSVFPYRPAATRELSRFAIDRWHGVFEAHSTDYQAPPALREMVRDHFAILKVGPWLTFAFREAVFALAAVEEEWLAGRAGVTLSRVRETLEDAMLRNPAHWRDYYHGDEAALRFARRYSYSDRARYYWNQPQVAGALDLLLANLTAHPAPCSLLHQYFPDASAGAASSVVPQPAALIRARIRRVLEIYSAACGVTSVNGGAMHAQ